MCHCFLDTIIVTPEPDLRGTIVKFQADGRGVCLEALGSGSLWFGLALHPYHREACSLWEGAGGSVSQEIIF